MALRQAYFDMKEYLTGLPQTPDHASVHTFDTPWVPGGLQVTGSGKPHRRPTNTCKDITHDWLMCVKNSPCFKEEGGSLWSCIKTADPDHVGQECIGLRKGYSKCRYELMKRDKTWYRGNHYT